MAYDKEAVEKEALKAIEDNFLTYFEDVVEFVEPSLRTLYDWKLQELQPIKDAIKKNRIRVKRQMRQRWQKSESAVLQIAAYKLIADNEEIERITMTKVQNEHSGKDGSAITIFQLPDNGRNNDNQTAEGLSVEGA